MMLKTADIVNQDDCLLVSGDLNFQTVVTLWERCQLLFADCSELHLDLTGVRNASSAGLALILEWVKYAKRTQKTLTLTHIPAQLKSIIVVGGIEKMLSPYIA